MLVDLIIMLVLFVVNGFFAMAEMAIVAARRARLEALAETGSRGAQAALTLAQNPGRFLSTVQTGVTLVGVVMGALSTTAVSAPLAVALRHVPGLSPAVASGIGFAGGIALTTYATLIIGELVPKQIALRRAEGIAVRVAGALALVARITLPVVLLLDFSARGVLAVLGIKRQSADMVSEEEVRTLIAEGTEHGVFHPSEGEMVGRVLRFADRPVRSIMTPRADMVWLPIDAGPREIAETIGQAKHTRFPVGRENADDIVGVVHVRDLLVCALTGQPLDLNGMAAPIPAIYESIDVLQALEVLRKAGVRMALVVDEYGGVEGIVTLTDVLEAVVGDLPEAGRQEESQIVERLDGSLLVDGGIAIEDIKIRLGLHALPGETEVSTLGGFMLNRLGRLPKAGDRLTYGDYVFEVVDMDGRRVDKLLISGGPKDESADDSG